MRTVMKALGELKNMRVRTPILTFDEKVYPSIAVISDFTFQFSRQPIHAPQAPMQAMVHLRSPLRASG